MKAVLTVLALGWLAVTPAAALDPSQVMRPCKRQDVLGVWRVMRLGVASGTDVDRSDPSFLPHQRYVFHADATMAYVSQEVPFTAEDQRALKTLPRSATWSLEGDGRLVSQRDGAAMVDKAECRVLLQPVKDPRTSQPTAQVGDILLTERSSGERSALRRLLRRVGSAD